MGFAAEEQLVPSSALRNVAIFIIYICTYILQNVKVMHLILLSIQDDKKNSYFESDW